MYEQSIVFGPLSVKQFTTLSIGVFLIYFVNKYSDNYIIIGAIALTTLFLIFVRFANKKIPVEELDIYFKQKKTEMLPEDYNIMLKTRMAELDSYIKSRAERGLIIDEDIYKVYDVIKVLKEDNI